jgi:hypothetical protein
MIPGNDEFYACPKCNQLHSKATLMSGNTFGAKYYSDARVEYPFLPKFPNITRCNNCKEIFRLETEISSLTYHEQNCDAADFLDINGYKDALLTVFYRNLEEELDLRFELLWKWHKMIEEGEMSAREVYSDSYYLKNIDEIIPAIKDSDLGRILLVAELNRYAGRFEIAAELFAPHLDETEFAIANESYKRCLNKDRSVYIVNYQAV